MNRISSENMKPGTLNKMIWRVGLPLLMLILLGGFSPKEAGATHIIGGELSYKCLGNGNYEIQFIGRRDCRLGDPEAQFDDPAYIGVFDAQGNPVALPGNPFGRIEIAFNFDDTLNESLTGCEVIIDTPQCVQQSIYKKSVFLPDRPGGYILSYQRCCRNISLTNVANFPVDTVGMTNVIHISEDAMATCNSSAVFPEFPPIYTCVNDTFRYSQAATDPDGDELKYRLFTPFTGASHDHPYPTRPSDPPYTPLTWLSPYTVDDVMGIGSLTPLTIDRETGEMLAVPEIIGQFLVGICVDEIRNQRIYNTTCREFEINVFDCGLPAQAAFVATDPLCDDLTLDVTNQSRPGQEFTWYFDAGNDLTLTDTAYQPDFTYDQEGTYELMLIAKSANCVDTARKTIHVLRSGLVPLFDLEMTECEDNIEVKLTDLSLDTLSPIVLREWEIETDTGTIFATGEEFIFTLANSQVVDIKLTITAENGCTKEISQTADLKIMDISYPETFDFCVGETMDLCITVNNNDDVTVSWEPNDLIVSTDSLCATLTSDEVLTTQVIFTAENPFGCTVTDTIDVEVGIKPAVSFEVLMDCESRKVQFINNSDTGHLFFWDFGDGGLGSIEWEPMYEYQQDGIYTVILLMGEAPCDSAYVLELDIRIDSSNIDNDIVACDTVNVELNPGGNPDWSYEWTPVSLLDDATAANPRATVTSDQTFYVTITIDRGDAECQLFDSVNVELADLFAINPSPVDTLVCDGDSILLTANPTENVVITWFDGADTIGTGNSILVKPDGEKTYTVEGYIPGQEECAKTESVTVRYNEINFSFSIIDPDQSVINCAFDTQKVIVLIDGPTGNYTYQWSPDIGVIGSVLDGDTLCIFIENAQEYQLIVTNEDLMCSDDTTITVQPTEVEEVSVVITGPELVCVGETVTLIATPTPGNLDYTYVWDVPGEVVGANDQAVIEYIASTTGPATVTITALENCEASATYTVEVRDLSALIQATADPNVVKAPDDVIQLDVTGGELTWDYTWTGPGLTSNNIINPTAIPGRELEANVYCVTVVDEFGCVGESCVTVSRMDPEECAPPFVFLPNAFSPNGDGHNEVLKVQGVHITAVELIIYNRWGQEVFHGFDQDDTWDGTYKGDDLEGGVYGYWLKVNCDELTYEDKGNVTLVR